MSKDQASIDHYLSSTNPKALTKPSEMLAALKDKTLDYKLPVLVHNTHADEQPGIDIITGLFRTFATENQVSFKTTDEAGNVKNVTLDIPTLLNKIYFLVWNFTENLMGTLSTCVLWPMDWIPTAMPATKQTPKCVPSSK